MAEKKDERDDRLAEALRANLRRRKDQARARADDGAAPTEDPAGPKDAVGAARKDNAS